jgi:hypothetical protein
VLDVGVDWDKNNLNFSSGDSFGLELAFSMSFSFCWYIFSLFFTLKKVKNIVGMLLGLLR